MSAIDDQIDSLCSEKAWSLEDARQGLNRRELSMLATVKQTGRLSHKGADVGRKRSTPKFKRDTMRHKFAHRLHALAGSLTYDQIAEAVGVSNITVAKWFSGQNMPDIEYWPKLARVFGLNSYRDLLP